jgi:ribosome recycling factor
MNSQQEVLAETGTRMQKSVQAFGRELNSLRTGRASPALVENIAVDYYSVPTPLNQLASISVPEPRVLMIQPWDKQTLQEVERGILKSDLGLVPNSDGTVIRITIPTLTEERHRDLVRVVRRKAEDGNVAVRNIRRESLERLRTLQKNKALSQDEVRRAQGELQRVTDSHIEEIDNLRLEKEAEVMAV